MAQNRDFCQPNLHSTPPLGEGGSVGLLPCRLVWVGKLEWLGYPMVKKNLKIFLFVLTEWRATNVTDRHTDRHTHGHRMTAKAALDASKNYGTRKMTHKSLYI